MKLSEIFNDRSIHPSHWIIWKKGSFQITKKKPRIDSVNRETLARVYIECVEEVAKKGVAHVQASCFIRSLWIEETPPKHLVAFPRIISDDGFLRMYAVGDELSVELFCRIWKRLDDPLEDKVIALNPLHIEWNEKPNLFFDVDATPPGLLPKLFKAWRIKKDEILLKQIHSDLEHVSNIEEPERKKWLTMAILSHAAVYRELEQRELLIPSFSEKGKMIVYTCRQHLIAEGVKTISLTPKEEAPSIYLCQGTELWPSQPSMLGSVLANFATHGSATEAYAHSWRRIHKHLRDLPGKPIVAGHSLGGALAIQIALYSHSLIESSYAFNPPLPHERDFTFYHQLKKRNQEKILISANLDDFAFWRIGAKVIGSVTVFLGKKRWRYFPVGLWDCVWIFPAFVKFILNVHHAFPGHQNIFMLHDNWVSVTLTREEVEKENQERTKRFDYLRFFPKLYDPLKTLFTYFHKIFGWSLEDQYLRNEIEILALHERDLIDTITEENKEDKHRQLRELRRQKGALIRRLLKR